MKTENARSLKIVKLEAENFMRLKAVEISPDGNLVIISGANAQGKSSVLNLISTVLDGKAATKGIIEPIRRGEKSAMGRIDLGDMVVERVWKGTTSNITITNKDGAVFKSPQAMLAKLKGRLSFDPLAFMAMSGKDQIAILLSLINLPIDLDAMDAKRKELFEFRASINRDVKALEGRRNAAPYWPDTPTEETDTVKLRTEFQSALASVSEKEQIDIKIQNATSRINQLKVELEATQKELERHVGEIKGYVAPDIEGIKAKLETVEEDNVKIRTQIDRLKIIGELETEQKRSKELTQKITDIDDLKAKAISEANMPVEGLGFDENGLTYNELPLSQCSRAESIRVVIGIGMAENPDLRVILVNDGSALDTNNLKLVAEAASKYGCQVWLEKVDETGTLGIVIEDGMVKA